ncbi:MAG: NUDIX domain-containing protein [Parvularculaceae bacterium]
MAFDNAKSEQEDLGQEYASILLRRGDGKREYYLQRRTNKAKPYYGKIGLFGGKREPTDSSPKACALREIHEETGLKFLEPSLIELGVIKSFNFYGENSTGYIFAIDQITGARLRSINPNDEGELVEADDGWIKRNWSNLTPIASFALSQHHEYLRIRKETGLVKKMQALPLIGRFMPDRPVRREFATG